MGGAEHVRSDLAGLMGLILGNQDASQGELSERAAAGAVAGPEADDAFGLAASLLQVAELTQAPGRLGGQ